MPDSPCPEKAHLLTVLLNYILLSLFPPLLSPPLAPHPISQVGHLTGPSAAIETKLHVYCILIRFPLVMIKGI